MVNPKLQVIIDARRTEALTTLQNAFADDLIDVDELDRRLTLVENAETPSALEALLADLPGTAAPGAALARRGAADAALEHVGAEPQSDSLLAVLGGSERVGHFRLAPHMSVVAFCGGAKLDLTQAEFGPGEHELRCTAVMGGIDIVLPEHVRVQSHGLGIMGGFDNRVQNPEADDAPVLNITGLAVWGGVSIRRPGFRERVRAVRERMRGRHRGRRRR